MGTVKLNIFSKHGKELQAKKLDPNDPKVKLLIENSIRAQEKIISLNKWDQESMNQIITI